MSEFKSGKEGRGERQRSREKFSLGGGDPDRGAERVEDIRLERLT